MTSRFLGVNFILLEPPGVVYNQPITNKNPGYDPAVKLSRLTQWVDARAGLIFCFHHFTDVQ